MYGILEIIALLALSWQIWQNTRELLRLLMELSAVLRKALTGTRDALTDGAQRLLSIFLVVLITAAHLTDFWQKMIG
jgi:hypothetical protein